MKNEVGKRVYGDVLYEPPEPLFPDSFPKRGRWTPRLLILFALIAIAVCVWMISVSGRSGDGGGEIDEGDTVDSTAEQSCESEARGESTEGVSESESRYPETEAPSETESKTEEAGTDDKCETDGEISDLSDIVEMDLSQVEKGDRYVINYSDRIADVGGLIDRGFIYTEEMGNAAPLVLVIHTHTSEEYLSGGSGYRGPFGVVSVGDVLSARLNSLGVTSVHCTVIHDGDGENAYLNAQKTIEMMLDIYPSIKYIVDVHRLSLASEGKIIKTVSGCLDGSAQIRLTVGAYDGDDSWQEDLSLALALRDKLNSKGARVCMPVVISPSISNSDMSEYYIMVDVGSSGNTVEEAMAAGERLAFAIADVVLE